MKTPVLSANQGGQGLRTTRQISPNSVVKASPVCRENSHTAATKAEIIRLYCAGRLSFKDTQRYFRRWGWLRVA